jgi:hypothetical protein
MKLSELKLSNFLLFPKERLSTADGLELTVFDNDSVSDRDTEEFLRMLVAADSVDEVRFCLTLAYQAWNEGRLNVDVNEFYGIED